MNEIKERIMSTVDEMLKTKPISKISVLEISKKCNINRNSFYYYFRTVSDVASELINQNMISVTEKYIMEDDWHKGMNIFKNLVISKRAEVLNCFKNDRVAFIQNIRTQLEHILDEYLRIQARGIEIEEKDIKIATMIYKNAFLGYFIDWLDSDMSDEYIKSLSGLFELLNGSTRGLFVRVEQQRKYKNRLLEKGDKI